MSAIFNGPFYTEINLSPAQGNIKLKAAEAAFMPSDTSNLC